MSQPAGWEQRAEILDEQAAHQIRIVQQGNSHVYLTCSCRTNQFEHRAPLGLFQTSDGAQPLIAAFNEHLAEVAAASKLGE